MYRIRWDRISYLLFIIIVAALYSVSETEKADELDVMYYIMPKSILFGCLIIIAWFNLRTPNER